MLPSEGAKHGVSIELLTGDPSGRLSHSVLRNKVGCISYMRQEDNIYNNRVYRDKCHKTSE
jgi:hypothetical protein